MRRNDTPIVQKGRLYVPYSNFYGATATKFFSELRDNKRLLATRCSSCNKTFMPPRSVCPNCFAQLMEWVELPTSGRLLTYTLVNYNYGSYYQPQQPPYIVGIVKIDGADTGLCHLIRQVDPKRLKIGMRVKAVFKGKRKGDILDIAFFKPVRKVNRG